MAVETMIWVFHTPGLKHGLDQLDTRLWMNGGLGLLMDKLLGKSKINGDSVRNAKSCLPLEELNAAARKKPRTLL